MMSDLASSNEFQPTFNVATLPANYGEVQAEYEAVRRGAGLLDLSPLGKLRIAGKNAVPFINGLVSNDVKTLPVGAGVLACFPTLQGKVAALAVIYHTPTGLLLELAAGNQTKIFQSLSRYVLAGEFFLTDVTNELALLSLQGPQAAAVLSIACAATIQVAATRTVQTQTISGITVEIAQRNRVGLPGFDLYVPATHAAEVWQTLLKNGAQPVGQTAFNIARLEAGIPHEPADINENYIINETNVTEAVSYNKGCYLGQEVIARIHWRGQPAKQLRGLWLESDAPPAAGTELWASDGKRIGTITSSVRSLATGLIIAFAYVHRNYLDAAQQFTWQTADGQLRGTARLAELPFVRLPEAVFPDASLPDASLIDSPLPADITNHSYAIHA